MTPDVAAAVKAAKAGEVQFRVEKAGVVHAGIGKASFGADQIAQNAEAFLEAIRKAKPAGAKGAYIKEDYNELNNGRRRICRRYTSGILITCIINRIYQQPAVLMLWTVDDEGP